MDSSSKFAPVPISSAKDFSWVFFVDWLLTVVLAIGIIFFFPRLLGIFLSLFIRLTVGRTNKFRADIQSVKFSFLGGRVMFTNLAYIDNDQTISALQGSLTWRYWLPKVRRRNFDIHNEDDMDIKQNDKLPCRYLLNLDGLEYFVYNRTVSYDNILKTVSEELRKDPANGNSSEDHKERFDVFSQSASDNSSQDLPEAVVKASPLASLFPLKVKINKGGVVMGNKSTRAVLVISCNSMSGVLDIKPPQNPLDVIRESYEFDVERLQISMKPNIIHELAVEKKLSIQNKDISRWRLVHRFVRAMQSLGQRKKKEQVEVWKGLSQYLGNDTNSTTEIGQEEEQDYAKYTNLLQANVCKFNYFYDLPGTVPFDPAPISPCDGIDIGNGGCGPKYGLSLQLSRGTVHYGPWADRQKHSLHQMMMPTICRDAVPHQKLRPGQKRAFTNFELDIEVLDDMIVRVPTRELSKDEEYKARDPNVPTSTRPFGWIELKLNKGSTISSSTSFVASKSGYENRLNMNLLDLEARSSVNHEVFLKAKKHEFAADVGYPLSWNGHTTWNFANSSTEVETFFLREHVTLFSDLFSDFGSGDPTPYELFRPFTYVFDWSIHGYKTFFNINDANIVNNPLDFNDNIYLSLQGDLMSVRARVPLDSVINRSITVDYNIQTPEFSLVLDAPPWHTLNNFLKSKEVGRSQDFSVDGSVTIYSEIGIDLIDTIIIACNGEYVALECYGFVVKYIMSIRENYFGDFTTFKTLEEYTRNIHTPSKEENTDIDDDQATSKHDHRRIENEADIHFSFCVQESCILLPSNIYDCNSNTTLTFDNLDIDIRFTNYYMDMQVNSTPIKGYFFPQCNPEEILDLKNFEFPEDNDLFIDCSAIHGLRMFGLPPDEPTCFCKWDILPGDILFNGSIKGLHGIINGGLKLAFGYSNSENKLELEEPELWDTTNLNIILPKIDFRFREPDLHHEISLCIVDFAFCFSDITNSRYTNRVSVDIHEIGALISDLNTTDILLDFKTSAKIANFCLKKDYEEIKIRQDEHIIVHDGPFHRLPFFVDDDSKPRYNKLFGTIVPGFSLPLGNPPVTDETVDIIFENMGIDTSTADDDFNLSEVDAESNTASSNTDSGVKSSFKTRSNWNTIFGINSKQTVKFDPDDYTPLLKGNPDLETDNFVLNFGEICLNLSFESVLVILHFCDKITENDPEVVLDNLHIEVLKKLKKKLNTDLSCVNFRFVAPVVNVNALRDPWKREFTEFSKGEHISFFVDNPSLACSAGKIDHDTDHFSAALHLDSLGVSLHKGNSGEGALELVLTDLEAWLLTGDEIISSLNLKSVDFSLHIPSLTWILSFVNVLLDYAEDFELLLNKITTKSKNSEIELMYQVAVASSKYNIEHDPPVLTRPAYIIRLSKKHIRANDSWNVVVRLRHIFNNLPGSFFSDSSVSCRDISHEDAMNEILKVFGQWRNWEFTDIANSFIFKYVFGKSEKTSDRMGASVEISTEIVLAKIFAHESQASFVELSEIELELDNENTITSAEGASQGLKLSSAKIESIKGDISPLLLELDTIVLPERDRNGNTSNAVQDSSSPKSTDLLYQFLVVVDEFDLKISLGHTSFRLTLNGVSSSVVSVKGDITTSADLDSLHFIIFTESKKLLSYDVSNVKITCGLVEVDKEYANMVHISSEAAIAHVFGTNEALLGFLDGTEKDIATIKKLLPPDQPKSMGQILPDDSQINIEKKSYDRIQLKVTNKSFNWRVAVLNPFELHGSSDSFEARFDLNAGQITVTLNGRSVESEVQTSIERYPVYSGKVKRISTRVHFDSDRNELAIGVTSDEIQAALSDALIKLKPIFGYFQEIQENAKSISKSVDRFLTVFKKDETDGSLKPEEPDLVIKELVINNGLFSFSTKLEDSLYSIDISKSSLKYNNLIFSSKPAMFWPYGEMNVASSQLNIKSNEIPLSHSSLINFGFKMKINNATETDTQTLEVESPYFRVMLTPQTFAKAYVLVKAAEYVGGRVKDIVGDDVQKPKRTTAEIWQHLGFSSIHILSYNFCAGFIFDDPTEASPGIITGCDKVFAVTEGSLGKFSIIGGYLSIANSASSNSFFSLGEEVLSPNRACLSNVQITYFISHSGNNKDIQINVSGEALNVKLVTSSLVVVEQTIKSIASTDRLVKQSISFPKVESMQGKSVVDVQENYSLPSDVTSIKCTMHYDGAIVKMSRWEDLTNDNDPYAPSFELRSPAVEIIGEYSKTHGVKNHFLTLEVFTLSSSNTLLSTCVPVLYDIWKTINYLGKHTEKQPSCNEKAIERQSSDKSELADLLKVLNKFHVQFALHIDKQELTLSCEPSAKVQAVVGINSIDIHLGSSSEVGSYPLSGSLKITDLGASLQHSFSREISGSVMIEEVILSAMIADGEGFKIYTSGIINKVQSYLYLKQLQDVDLFLDLWKFGAGGDFSSESIRSMASSIDKNDVEITLKNFQRMSNSSFIPWDIYYLIKNINFEIYLGQSLGVSSLVLDKVCMTSRKQSDRKQDLVILFDTVSLKSNGRLNGHVIVHGIKVGTVINWSMLGDDYDDPNVLLSFGFDDVETEVSFDYNMFMVGKIRKTRITVYNQVDEEKRLRDKLFAKTECQSIELFFTVFAASNIMDIYNTLSRIRQDNRTSYKQNLKEVPFTHGDMSKRECDITDALAKLRTELDVKFGYCLLHIYPSSLLDSQVLVINIAALDANFEQHSIEELNKLESSLKLSLNKINVSLSSFKSQLPEERLPDLSVTEFIENSKNAQGGSIFTFPSLRCAMTTLIKPKSTLVEYTYDSSFGGKVDIRWNLGSINFIREMWMVHVKSFSTRFPSELKEASKPSTTNDDDGKVPLIMDEKLDEKIKDVKLGDKFQYLALEPARIEAPQLKELGNATPPLEWFGLNRQNFPGLTHQFVIVSLQKLVHEAETRYGRVLGNA